MIIHTQKINVKEAEGYNKVLQELNNEITFDADNKTDFSIDLNHVNLFEKVDNNISKIHYFNKEFYCLVNYDMLLKAKYISDVYKIINKYGIITINQSNIDILFLDEHNNFTQ
jgi:hypothetical protein